MRIFLITDNKWWYQKAIVLFAKYDYDVSYFCSTSSKNLFSEEINSNSISTISIKSHVQYLTDNFDFGISAHCKQIFPKRLIEEVRCINIHPGFNPYNRGWYPQVFSILNKHPAGATIHLIDEKIDHGDILFQKMVKINSWDTSKSVYDRILQTEYDLFEGNLRDIIEGKSTAIKMTDEGNYNSIADYRALLEIDLDKVLTMREAIDFFRAMTHPPYRNAYYLTDNGEKVFLALSIEKEIQ